jgi:5-methylcytosine-specific restriction endonuclease McrA
MRKSCLQWKTANPEACRAYAANRRALNKGAEGQHTAFDIAALWKAQDGKCAACRGTLPVAGKHRYHVDHIVALSKGGSNWPKNIQLLCPRCNLSKHNRDFTEWARIINPAGI